MGGIIYAPKDDPMKAIDPRTLILERLYAAKVATDIEIIVVATATIVLLIK
jgi:hypothetical protein